MSVRSRRTRPATQRKRLFAKPERQNPTTAKSRCARRRGRPGRRREPRGAPTRRDRVRYGVPEDLASDPGSFAAQEAQTPRGRRALAAEMSLAASVSRWRENSALRRDLRRAARRDGGKTHRCGGSCTTGCAPCGSWTWPSCLLVAERADARAKRVAGRHRGARNLKPGQRAIETKAQGKKHNSGSLQKGNVTVSRSVSD